MDDQAAAQQINAARWYHQIEVREGLITKGWKTSNSTVSRAILSGVDIEGRNCIDLGAMDCLYSILMTRRNAKRVLAFDRKDRRENIALLRYLLDSNFDYYFGVKMVDVRAILDDVIGGPADVVNFIGVLYHMFDPFRGLGLARGMVRRGGIVVLDVPALVSDDHFLAYNHDQKLYGHGTYFAPSVPCLQSMTEFLGFEILDAVFTKQSGMMRLPQVRVCLALRAKDVPIYSEKNVPFWVPTYSLDDFDEFMKREELVSNDDAAVKYSATVTPCYAEHKPLTDLAKFCKSDMHLDHDETNSILRLHDVC